MLSVDLKSTSYMYLLFCKAASFDRIIKVELGVWQQRNTHIITLMPCNLMNIGTLIIKKEVQIIKSTRNNIYITGIQDKQVLIFSKQTDRQS